MPAPAFQFYAADYLADANVQLMSLEEEGCYIRLLAFCWRQGSIPSDETLLSRLCKGASTTVIRVVKGCFNQHPEDASKLVHPRLEKEREKQTVWREKSAEGGRKSAEKRRERQSKTKGGPKGGSTKRQPARFNTSSSSSSSNNISPARAESEGEVISYVVSLGFPPTDGSYLWNSWEAGGWKRGTQKIKNWKAAVRSWRDGGYLPSQKGGNHAKHEKSGKGSGLNAANANANAAGY